MDMPLLTSCEDFLWRAAAVARGTGSGRDAEPTSVFAAELALDEEWEDEPLGPYELAHHITGALIWAAGERLGTLSWCAAADPPHVVSLGELARAGAEAAALAMWLGAEVPPRERAGRLLGVVAASGAEVDGLRRLFGLDAEPGMAQSILTSAERRGLARIPRPNRTRLLELADPLIGRMDYSRLSAAAHSNVFALLDTWLAIVELQEHRDAVPVKVHTWRISLCAAYYTLSACRLRRRLKGQRDDDVVALLSELVAWDQDVDRAIAHM